MRGKTVKLREIQTQMKESGAKQVKANQTQQGSDKLFHNQ